MRTNTVSSISDVGRKLHRRTALRTVFAIANAPQRAHPQLLAPVYADFRLTAGRGVQMPSLNQERPTRRTAAQRASDINRARQLALNATPTVRSAEPLPAPLSSERRDDRKNRSSARF